jgi:group I intron endonuclease
MYGKKHSEDSRQLVSVAKLGVNNPMYGKVGPRLGLSAYNAITVYVYSAQDDSLVQTFPTQAAAAEWLNSPRSTVQNYLRSGKCFKGLYLIRSSVL